MSHYSSRLQKAAKWVGKASLLAANQHLKYKQQQSESPQDLEKTLDLNISETSQDAHDKPDQPSRRQKLWKWGKQASLVAASKYLRRDNPQRSEQKKPTLLETLLEIIKVSVYAICAIALTILLLTLRFGYGVH